MNIYILLYVGYTRKIFKIENEKTLENRYKQNYPVVCLNTSLMELFQLLLLSFGFFLFRVEMLRVSLQCEDNKNDSKTQDNKRYNAKGNNCDSDECYRQHYKSYDRKSYFFHFAAIIMNTLCDK